MSNPPKKKNVHHIKVTMWEPPPSRVSLTCPQPNSLYLIQKKNDRLEDDVGVQDGCVSTERGVGGVQRGRPRHTFQTRCSVTREKREPFLGKTILSGAATKEKGKKGATEQLRNTCSLLPQTTLFPYLVSTARPPLQWRFPGEEMEHPRFINHIQFRIPQRKKLSE